MANHKSAKKRILQNQKRSLINKNRISRIRTFIKKVESAIQNGDVANAKQAFIVAQPEMARGVTKGVFDKKTISRKTSRLAKQIKNLELSQG